MDNLKIHDTQFSHVEKPSKMESLLDSKLQRASISTEENSNRSSKKVGFKTISPKFKFKIVSFTIGETVKYEVELIEEFKVLRQTIRQVYKFKTRYSKLQALDEKVKGKGFPPKKIFGNKNRDFVQQRKKQLEIYLNSLILEKSAELIQFILQIKQVSQQVQLKKPFQLPA